MMIHKAIIFLALFLLACGQPALATPPSDIKLSYDLASHTLTVEIAHVTQRLLDHYIRKIEIQKNEEPPIAQYLKRQDSPSGVEKEFIVNAEEGDTIMVKAYCQEGGSKEASVVVEKLIGSDKVAPTEEEPAASEPAMPKDRY